ncbi:hypothetical protein PRIPAC_87842, partial [Pristionchus pacificus]|uniref:Large ribosomal subunit protein uL29 n=1 Tax=Pristionchus pacificus TaxID=54126 RepID=A0A2A6B7A5_PRIPA
VVYVTGGAASKLSKIRVVRKNILDQTDGQRAVLCVALSPSSRLPSRLTPSFQAKKCLPTDIRYKKTRAMRRALTKHEASIKSAKQQGNVKLI